MEVCTVFEVSCTWKALVVSGSHSADGTQILRQSVWICLLLPNFPAMPAPIPLHLLQAQRFTKLFGIYFKTYREDWTYTYTCVCVWGVGGDENFAVGGWDIWLCTLVQLEFCSFEWRRINRRRSGRSRFWPHWASPWDFNIKKGVTSGEIYIYFLNLLSFVSRQCVYDTVWL